MRESTLISVRVSKETAKRLEALADAIDRSKSSVAAEAIEEYLSVQEWQVKAIRRSSAEAQASKLLSHDEARARLARWRHRGP